jgi:hypothetical protein
VTEVDKSGVHVVILDVLDVLRGAAGVSSQLPAASYQPEKTGCPLAMSYQLSVKAKKI